VRCRFHAYKSVAPLKRAVVNGTATVAVFPRLQKRGPIEARPLTGQQWPPALFPRLQKRGPIEAAVTNVTE